MEALFFEETDMDLKLTVHFQPALCVAYLYLDTLTLGLW